MKNPIIICVVSLVIGIAIGWSVKSASPNMDGVTHLPDPVPPRTKPTPPPADNTPETPDRPDRPTQLEDPGDFVPILGADTKAPESVKSEDRAKWTRLIEVLGLNADQAKALQANIEETRLTPAPDESPDLAYERAGDELQEKVLAVLTQEQQQAFRDFQKRSIENKIEAKAHGNYASELSGLDLTPAQREQALDILRSNAETEVNAVPENTRLLLQDSILPIGNAKFSEEAIVLLRKIGSQSETTAPANMSEIAAMHRAEIEKKMGLYEGILTPGQLQRYQAKLSESLESLEKISPQN